ncbi:hypothetical protein H6P81_014981 [Aristolochia fimbriata]|uniref:Pentatricopeptide repeat-containing protein n=1 Tax=Aristolochia fimbriata TaxID=158543 RepID=A0AAV7E738_ARIFI|nr:hypothetical protein H6P81_014981 [Aristolochia fimbriata]
MYSETGEIENAHMCFDEMPERDLVSWNSLISCYSNHGMSDVSLELFRRMRREGLAWDEFTIATVTNGLTSTCHISLAEQVHSLIIRSGFCFDRFTVNTLICLYSKCGNVESATQMFSEIHEADVVSWTTMIAGLNHSGYWNEVMCAFNQMRSLEIHPNSFTFGGLFSTCASSNSFEKGKEYHGLAIKYGLESDVVVGSAIVDMYSKCGEMQHAKEFFQRMPERDIVSWNGMICGFAQNGEAVEALNLFHEMVQIQGIFPNNVTFTGVLTACSHSGFVQKGRQLFNDLVHVYKIRPSAEHYTCMVDILARAGLLEDAETLLLDLPLKPDSVMWGTLLGACRRYGELVTAESRKAFGSGRAREFLRVCALGQFVCQWE